MRSFVERAIRRTTELGLSHQDGQDIGFALVALIDEVVIAKSGELRDYWLPRLLQLQFFNTNIAGDEFFNRLNSLLGESSRVEVLKVYYLVLLFGFQGRYQIKGGENQLMNEIEGVANSLKSAGHLREVNLSPSGARPREGGGAVGRNLPIIAISVVILVLAFFIYLGFYWSISNRGEDIVQQIGQPNTNLAQSQGQ
jgi:type VI secretion system protein ImpK